MMFTKNLIAELQFSNLVCRSTMEDYNGEFFFQIYNITTRPRTKIVDAKGNELKQLNPENYSGYKRNALTLYNRSSLGAEGQIYLDLNPYMMFEMIKCENLVTKDMTPLKVNTENYHIELIIDQYDKESYITTIEAVSADRRTMDFYILTGNYILCGTEIFPINNIGNNGFLLPQFNCKIPTNQLNAYLSTIYSYFENLTLCVNKKKIKVNYDLKEKLETDTTISIEESDPNNLVLSITQTLPDCEDIMKQGIELAYWGKYSFDDSITLTPITYKDNNSEAEQFHVRIRKYVDTVTEWRLMRNGNYFTIPTEYIEQFMIFYLPALVANHSYKLIGVDNMSTTGYSVVHPELSVEIHYGVHFFEASPNVKVDNHSYYLSEFINLYDKNKYILLSDGTKGLVSPEYMKKMKRIFYSGKQNKEHKMVFSLYDLLGIRHLLMDDPEVIARIDKKVDLLFYDNLHHLKDKEIDLPKLNIKLRDYQILGLKWLMYMYANKFGCCLADDMGLGKTIQTIALLAKIYEKEKRPSLIVMPKSLLFNWEEELAKVAPQLKIHTLHGSQWEIRKAARCNVILTTYDTIRIYWKHLSVIDYHCIILDESQKIKNINSQTYDAVCQLSCVFRLSLSGTPFENNLLELYALFHFLNPSIFESFDDFHKKYFLPITRKGDKDSIRELKQKIYPFVLRRIKEEVIDELPKLTEETIEVKMSDDHAYLYQKWRLRSLSKVHGAKSKMAIFRALSELRQIASVPEMISENVVKSSKADIVNSHLLYKVKEGHKIIVFFSYLKGIDILGDSLQKHHIEFLTLTGKTENRKEVVENFNTNPNIKVLLMTLKTGGVGLNLTSADTVYIFEPWWNKAAENQAVDRLHRIGQTKDVTCYSVITKDTIEQKMQELQRIKSDLFEEILSTQGNVAKILSAENVEYLIGN